MSARYYVDVSRNLLRDMDPQLADSAGFTLIEKHSDLPDAGASDGGLERWLAEDRDTDPSLEGLLVDPVFQRTYGDVSGVTSVKITQRNVRNY